MSRFGLAPMTSGLRLLTLAVLAVPLALLAAALGAPFPVSAVLGGTAAFVALVYASVWLWWRPTRFEVDPRGLRIVWPFRSRSIPARDILDARALTAAEFHRAYGYGVRFGAGGLWGGFGLLRTRRETFSLYVSRTDRFVLVSLRGTRSLLVTPAEPERFIDALRAFRA